MTTSHNSSKKSNSSLAFSKYYPISFLLGLITTVVLFFSLNTFFDSQLRENFNKEFKNDLGQSLKSALQYFRNVDSIRIENFEGISDSIKNTPQNIQIDDNMFRSAIMYGEDSLKLKGWRNFAQLKILWLSKENTQPKYLDILSALNFESLKNNIAGGRKNEKFLDLKEYFNQEYLEPFDKSLKSNRLYGTYFKSRRYINGFIQFITFFIGLSGIYLLIFSMRNSSRDTKHFKSVLTNVTNGIINNKTEENKIGNLVSRLRIIDEVLHPSEASQRNDENSISDSKLKNRVSKRKNNIYLPSLITVGESIVFMGKESAENALEREADEIRTQYESRMGMIQFFAWVVPSIGFIGTIIGIGDALGNAHEVIGQSGNFETKSAVQSITAQLGVAFDTTLVALFFSIILVLLIHYVNRKQEKNTLDFFRYMNRKIISPIFTIKQDDKLTRFTLLLDAYNRFTRAKEKSLDSFSNFKESIEEEIQKLTKK